MAAAATARPSALAGLVGQSGEPTVLEVGDRMFIACEGGPCTSRLEAFPPRLEVEEPEDMYVLFDDGRRDEWRYMFVPREP